MPREERSARRARGQRPGAGTALGERGHRPGARGRGRGPRRPARPRPALTTVTGDTMSAAGRAAAVAAVAVAAAQPAALPACRGAFLGGADVTGEGPPRRMRCGDKEGAAPDPPGRAVPMGAGGPSPGPAAGRASASLGPGPGGVSGVSASWQGALRSRQRPGRAERQRCPRAAAAPGAAEGLRGRSSPAGAPGRAHGGNRVLRSRTSGRWHRRYRRRARGSAALSPRSVPGPSRLGSPLHAPAHCRARAPSPGLSPFPSFPVASRLPLLLLPFLSYPRFLHSPLRPSTLFSSTLSLHHPMFPYFFLFRGFSRFAIAPLILPIISM